MPKFSSKIKELLLDLLFPKFCLNCNKEGTYLCQDCFSLIDIFKRQYCPFCSSPKIVPDGKTCNSCRKSKKLAGLYCAVSYDNFIVKKLINQFKYEPYIKELSKPLAFLIVTHLINLNPVRDSENKEETQKENISNEVNNLPNFKEFILVPVPLHKKKLKQRGFNQASEIGKELSKNLKVPLFDNVLIKIKQTLAQVELKKEQREKNIKGVFNCQKPELIKNKKILLVDDILTTGSTMEECARVLKTAGAKQVWGVVVARG